jgi:hypothetical protein
MQLELKRVFSLDVGRKGTLKPARSAFPKYAQHDGRSHQRLGWRDQPGDSDKRVDEVGVLDGRSVQPRQICARQSAPEGSASADAGKDQVAACRYVPSHIDHASDITEPAISAWLDAPREVAVEGERLQRCHAHTLAVDRVEAGHRIAYR